MLIKCCCFLMFIFSSTSMEGLVDLDFDWAGIEETAEAGELVSGAPPQVQRAASTESGSGSSSHTLLPELAPPPIDCFAQGASALQQRFPFLPLEHLGSVVHYQYEDAQPEPAAPLSIWSPHVDFTLGFPIPDVMVRLPDGRVLGCPPLWYKKMGQFLPSTNWPDCGFCGGACRKWSACASCRSRCKERKFGAGRVQRKLGNFYGSVDTCEMCKSRFCKVAKNPVNLEHALQECGRNPLCWAKQRPTGGNETKRDGSLNFDIGHMPSCCAQFHYVACGFGSSGTEVNARGKNGNWGKAGTEKKSKKAALGKANEHSESEEEKQ